ncbi:VAS1 ATPase, partial [Dicaeum eximium]|nr:VAS1 ATPase [Dicaeum eximium]
GDLGCPGVIWGPCPLSRALWPPLAAPGGRVLSGPELQQLLEPGLRQGPPTVLLFLQDQWGLGLFGVIWDILSLPFSQGALGSAGSALTVPSLAADAAAALPLTLQRALGAPP